MHTATNTNNDHTKSLAAMGDTTTCHSFS